MRVTRVLGPTTLAFLVLTGVCLGNGAYSQVDVGRRHADAQAGYDAPAGFARTESRVGNVNLGRGLAIGYGPGGISLSHSIGLVSHGVGTAHNFQLSVGPNGTHAGHSGVVSRGGDTRVIAGGHTSSGPRQPQGGNFATGFGRRTDAWSHSHVNARRAPARSHFPSR